MAIKLKEMGYDNFVIYEMLSDLGGTWFANTYPGCCCDIKGSLYSYSFSPNPGANRAYPTQPETLEYIQSVATKYHLHRHIQFNSQVVECRYSETNTAAKWTVTVRQQAGDQCTTERVECAFVCSATGILTIPKYPPLNLSDFKGKMIHSAEWDHDYDFEGKRVAVIGTGCSALQVVPALAERANVQRLDVYQRTPGIIQSTFGER